MTKVRVAVLDDYQNLALELADWAPVRRQADVVVFDRHLSEDEAVDALRDFDAICLTRERMALPGSLLERLPRLKFIAVTGPHNRTLDFAAADRLGITVSCTQRSAKGQFATAELAWGLILALARNLPAEAAGMKEGHWQRSVGIALAGKTLGLIGLGRLGSHMVPIARAFGMDVIAWSQNLTDDKAAAAGARRVDKDVLFRDSDFVSLHLVLSERSRHIVGAADIAAMKPSAFLVNTARGPLIEHAALLKALQERRIAGAALDTFDVEPLPADDALRKLDNVILTPHLGYTVRELLQPFYEATVENLLAWQAGSPLRVLSAAQPHLAGKVVQ
ncbi:D-2-hydroxyacid dehydrogenase family protein [Bordetella sp. N]|uniref:D-2-hydroxyacid dehydrogenase family protein n=1 Tax=Bordetella sp. N TaxID=1746199 RepID=UPI00070FCF3D|nr:D-2-hydroxyacid dehydrogenase family protein [Bordetella sp. N]ALM83607.1 hydroxyacid dehydrogenase [Bordetella sp. N]